MTISRPLHQRGLLAFRTAVVRRRRGRARGCGGSCGRLGRCGGCCGGDFVPWGSDGECNEYLESVTGPGGLETVVACTMEWPTGVAFDGGAAEVSVSLPSHHPWSGVNAFGDVTELGCDASVGFVGVVCDGAGFQP